MSDLTAIDILVDPDEDAVDRAREVNARVLRSMPGWVLDDTHEPHITMLQRYVRTDDLDQVYDAVEQTVAATDMASLSYEAVKITHADGLSRLWAHGAPRRGQPGRARLPGRPCRRRPPFASREAPRRPS